MIEILISSIITGGISIIGIVYSHYMAGKKVQEELKLTQKIMENELSHIKESVKEHNSYAKMFSENIPVIKEQIKVINTRLEGLEKWKKL